MELEKDDDDLDDEMDDDVYKDEELGGFKDIDDIDFSEDADLEALLKENEDLI